MQFFMNKNTIISKILALASFEHVYFFLKKMQNFMSIENLRVVIQLSYTILRELLVVDVAGLPHPCSELDSNFPCPHRFSIIGSIWAIYVDMKMQFFGH